MSLWDFISPQMASMPKHLCNGCMLDRGIALNSLPYNCHYFVTMSSICHNYYRLFQSLLSSTIYGSTVTPLPSVSCLRVVADRGIFYTGTSKERGVSDANTPQLMLFSFVGSSLKTSTDHTPVEST